MAPTVRDTTSVIGRLANIAMRGKKVTNLTICKSEVDYCLLKLPSEGLYVHYIVKASRRGLYSLKVEWSKPSCSDGAAAELLAIAEKAHNQPALKA